MAGRSPRGALLAAGSWCALQLLGCGSGADRECPKTCAADRDGGNMTTGFTDNTGFSDGKEDACCDICALKPSSNSTYDWDYVVMDSLFVPQFCQGLADGHDLTLTNVEGASCASGWQKAKLQIHGLWPNWSDTYHDCCLNPAPLDPAEVRSWSVYSDLQQLWSDAAAEDCEVCFNLNHEWQKHGKCVTQKAETYFNVGLGLYEATQVAMDTITDNLAKSQGGTLTVTELLTAWNASFEAEQQKPYAINIMCDPQGPGKKVGKETLRYFSELQVCWNRTSGMEKGVPLNLSSQLELIDCPPSAGNAFMEPCGETFAVFGSSKLVAV